MRVIFLDIDGALNYREFIYSREKRHKSRGYRPATKAEKQLQALVPEDAFGDHLWMFRAIDGKKVRLLETLTQATGAKVVISSSWRRGLSKDYLGLYLKCFGLTAEVIGSTPTDLHCREEYVQLHEEFGHTMRGWEIQEWLKGHPEVSSYVILDDESDMGSLMPRLVQTSFEVGLTQAHVDRAIQLLNT
jgi:hypothetical protein